MTELRADGHGGGRHRRAADADEVNRFNF